MQTKTLKYYFHIHHGVLLEPLTEPLKNRIKYIKEEKPKDEVELRLRLIKPVKGKLPVRLVKAWEAYTKAGKAYGKAVKAYGKAGKAYGKAEKAYDKAWEDNMPALKKLYRRSKKAYLKGEMYK